MSSVSETLKASKCPELGCERRSFSSKSNLNRHIMSFHGHKAQMPCGEMRANHASNNKRHAKNCGNCRAINTERHSAACDFEARQDRNPGWDGHRFIQQELGALHQNDFSITEAHGKTGNPSNVTFNPFDVNGFGQNIGNQYYDHTWVADAAACSAFGASDGQNNPFMGADLEALDIFLRNTNFNGQGR